MKKRIAIIFLHLLIMLVFCIMVFYPQFGNKVLDASDINQWEFMIGEIKSFLKNGEPILWTNSMFGGMPTFQIYSFFISNLVGTASNYFFKIFAFPLGYAFVGMISFYMLLGAFKINKWISLVIAIIFGLNTNNLILLEAGHTSKLLVISYAPIVLAGLKYVMDKKYLLGGVLFGIGLSLVINANHIQMTYYFGLGCIIFIVYMMILYLIRREGFSHLIKVSLVLLFASLLGLASNASNLWTTYEYGQFTMRGKPILAKKINPTTSQSTSSEVEGLDWNYAMNWSNGTKDLMATFIAKFAGGGSGEWVDPKSDFAKKIGQRKEFRAGVYWGDLPFTSGPIYFGALMIFLFFFTILSYKDKSKWWIVFFVVFTAFLSMGDNFSILNKFIYNNLPLYNKFRAPSSILSVTIIFVYLLSAIGLSSFLEDSNKERYLKPLYISLSLIGGIALIFWLFGGGLFSFSGSNDSQYQNVIELLTNHRRSVFVSSSFKTFIFILLLSGILWAYIKNHLKKNIVITIFSFLTIIDVFGVSNDYFNSKNWVNKSKKEVIQPREVDKQILGDTDPYYRVFDVTGDPFNSAFQSYFHKTIGGYHAAKLQRYQDIIDNHISKSNMNVLNMLNTKYFITNTESGPIVQQNPEALGNAWYVDTLLFVSSANQEIDKLTGFNPKREAIIHDEFKNYVNGLSLPSEGSISLKQYHPNKLIFESISTQDGFIVFSDIWYGPNAGWEAKINGKFVEHIRTNYCLRGLRVPKGKNEIVFEFKPKSYYIGEKISLASSSILLLLFVFYFTFEIYKLYINQKEV